MTYKEFSPDENLRAFVKCFYLSEYDTNEVVHDRAFATGSIELMFNLGGGSFQVGRNDRFTTTPRIELWGQIIEPLDFRSLGKNKVLGIRFHPHTAVIILRNLIHEFNDRVTDYRDIAGPDTHQLHEQLLNAKSTAAQVGLLGSFVTKKVASFLQKNSKFQIVNNVIADMNGADFCANIQDVAFRYGISSRYLQKLFLEFTGITPKLFNKIVRFQKGLVLAANNDQSLTSIAYQSGYFDQSHFIRDFKLFTGMSPSLFDSKNSSAIFASTNR